jgi:hypothetical protein
MLTEIKTKIKFCLLGAVLNVNFSIIKLCLNIIVIVVSLNNLNTKEIYNHILVDKFAVEKEDHIVHIHVPSFVIKESVSLANTKEPKLSVNVEKAQES